MYNIGDKVRIMVNGRFRIPDGAVGKILSEVKNLSPGKVLSYTRQLRDYAAHAGVHGLRFDLYVRHGVKLPSALEKEAASGRINVMRF